MATIDMTRNHALGKDEAKRRANDILAKMQEKYGVKGAWKGDTFDITAPAKGSFVVTDSNVRIQLDLPFLLRPIKGKIESRITEEFDRSLK